MAIVDTRRVTELRFFDSDTPAPFEPYKAICTLIELDSKTVNLTGFHGTINRKDLRDLVKYLQARGYEKLVCQRKDGGKLPLGVQLGDEEALSGWWFLDLGTVEHHSIPK